MNITLDRYLEERRQRREREERLRRSGQFVGEGQSLTAIPLDAYLEIRSRREQAPPAPILPNEEETVPSGVTTTPQEEFQNVFGFERAAPQAPAPIDEQGQPLTTIPPLAERDAWRFEGPGGATNLPQRNLNPLNLKAGGVGDQFASKGPDGQPLTDAQGHLIFPSADAGWKAGLADLQAKIGGSSQWSLGPTSTLAELGRVWAEDPNWPAAVASISGYPVETPIGQIPVNELAKAMARQEGWNVGAEPQAAPADRISALSQQAQVAGQPTAALADATALGPETTIDPTTQQQIAAAPTTQPATGVDWIDEPTALARGVNAAIDQYGPLTGSAIEAMGTALDNEDLVQAGIRIREGTEPERPTQLKAPGVFEIQDTGDALTWVGETFGQGVGYMLPMVAAGLGAAKGAAAAGITGAAAAAAKWTAVGVPTLLQSIGEAWDEFTIDPQTGERRHMTPEELKTESYLALGGGALIASLDVVSAKALGLLPFRRAFFNATGTGAGVAKSIAGGAGTEGVTEMAQELTLMSRNKWRDGTITEWSEADLARLGESFAAGSLVGGGMRTPSAIGETGVGEVADYTRRLQQDYELGQQALEAVSPPGRGRGAPEQPMTYEGAQLAAGPEVVEGGEAILQANKVLREQFEQQNERLARLERERDRAQQSLERVAAAPVIEEDIGEEAIPEEVPEETIEDAPDAEAIPDIAAIQERVDQTLRNAGVPDQQRQVMVGYIEKNPAEIPQILARAQQLEEQTEARAVSASEREAFKAAVGEKEFEVPGVIEGEPATVFVDRTDKGWRSRVRRQDGTEVEQDYTDYDQALQRIQSQYSVPLERDMIIEREVEVDEEPVEAPPVAELSLYNLFRGKLRQGSVDTIKDLVGASDDRGIRMAQGRLQVRKDAGGGAGLEESLQELWDGANRPILEAAGITGPEDIEGLAKALSNKESLYRKVPATTEDRDLALEEQAREEEQYRLEMEAEAQGISVEELNEAALEQEIEAIEEPVDEEDDLSDIPFDRPRGMDRPELRFSRDELGAQAIAQWGLTEEPSDAGYILPDGEMLDFSGGQGMGRVFDHRDINALGIDPETDEGDEMLFDNVNDLGSSRGYMLDFMNRGGAVRLHADDDYVMIDFMRSVTPSQKRRLVQMAAGKATVAIDIGHMDIDPYYDDGRLRYVEDSAVILDYPTAGEIMAELDPETAMVKSRAFETEHPNTLVPRSIVVAPQRIKNKMKGTEALKILRKNGIKEAELFWSGLDVWLEGQDKVVAEDIVDFMKDRAPRVLTWEAGTPVSKKAKLKVVGDITYHETIDLYGPGQKRLGDTLVVASRDIVGWGLIKRDYLKLEEDDQFLSQWQAAHESMRDRDQPLMISRHFLQLTMADPSTPEVRYEVSLSIPGPDYEPYMRLFRGSLDDIASARAGGVKSAYLKTRLKVDRVYTTGEPGILTTEREFDYPFDAWEEAYDSPAFAARLQETLDNWRDPELALSLDIIDETHINYLKSTLPEFLEDRQYHDWMPDLAHLMGENYSEYVLQFQALQTVLKIDEMVLEEQESDEGADPDMLNLMVDQADTIRGATRYESPHWEDVAGNVAHARTVDMKGSMGERYMWLWETQSDPSQAIRDMGTPDMKERDDEAHDRLVVEMIDLDPASEEFARKDKELKQIAKRRQSGSPYTAVPVPWTGNAAYEMPIRTMLRVAIEKGYDGILLPEGRDQWEVNGKVSLDWTRISDVDREVALETLEGGGVVFFESPGMGEGVQYRPSFNMIHQDNITGNFFVEQLIDPFREDIKGTAKVSADPVAAPGDPRRNEYDASMLFEEIKTEAIRDPSWLDRSRRNPMRIGAISDWEAEEMVPPVKGTPFPSGIASSLWTLSKETVDGLIAAHGNPTRDARGQYEFGSRTSYGATTMIGALLFSVREGNQIQIRGLGAGGPWEGAAIDMLTSAEQALSWLPRSWRVKDNVNQGRGFDEHPVWVSNRDHLEAYSNMTDVTKTVLPIDQVDAAWEQLQRGDLGQWSHRLNAFQAFYEQVVPNLINKMSSKGKWGVRVEDLALDDSHVLEDELIMRGIRFTDEMKKQVRAGQAMWESSVPLMSPFSNGWGVRALRDDDALRVRQQIRSAKYKGEAIGTQDGVKTLARAVSRDLETKGHIDLGTIKLETSLERAKAFQVFRNPHYETMRLVVVDADTNQELSTIAWTSNAVDYVGSYFDKLSKGKWSRRLEKMAETKGERWFQEAVRRVNTRLLEGQLKRIKRRASKGQIKVHLVHNHPGGTAKPSRNDQVMTRVWADLVGKVPGAIAGDHTVIDTGEFAVVDAEGNYNLYDLATGDLLVEGSEYNRDERSVDQRLESRRQKMRREDPLLGMANREYAGRVNPDWLEQPINYRRDLALIGEALQSPGHYASVLFQDSQNYIRGIMEMPVDKLRAMSDEELEAWIKERSVELGGRRATLFYGGEDGMRYQADEFIERFEPLAKSGVLEDAIHLPGRYQAGAENDLDNTPWRGMPEELERPVAAEEPKVMRPTPKDLVVKGHQVPAAKKDYKDGIRHEIILDRLPVTFPDPLASEDEWLQYWASVSGPQGKQILKPPYKAIEYRNDPRVIVDMVNALSPEQIRDKEEGFDLLRKTRADYLAGKVAPQESGLYLLWGILSRMASPYEQEAMFTDVVADPRLYDMITRAIEGDFPLDHRYRTVDDKGKPSERPGNKAWDDWVDEISAKSGESPGAYVKSNLRSFGYDRAGKILYEGAKKVTKDQARALGGHEGKTRLRAWHDMLTEPDMTGKALRRNWQKLFDKPGIDNKVVSFVALVSGFDDVLILDRVKARELWDGIGRRDEFKNQNVYSGEFTAQISGMRGLAMYEALEEGLREPIQQAYQTLGRPQDGTMGSWHWESWVVASNQEVGHGSLEIMSRARGAAPTGEARQGVMTRLGKYDTFGYGAEYGYLGEAPAYLYRNAEGLPYIYDQQSLNAFMADLKYQAGRKVLDNEMERAVPYGFKVSQDFRTDPETGDLLPPDADGFPWVNHPRVNRGAIDQLARQHGRLPDYSEAQALGLTYADQRAYGVIAREEGRGFEAENKGETMKLYHGSNSGSIDEVSDEGLFGGVFAGDQGSAESHITTSSGVLHEIEIPEEKVLTQRAFNYDLPFEEVRGALKRVASNNYLNVDDDTLDLLYSLIIEEKNVFDFPDEGPVLKALDMASFEDLGEASWKAQRLRGEVAKDLGYQAVETSDEHGTSYLVLPGASIKPIDPADPNITREAARGFEAENYIPLGDPERDSNFKKWFKDSLAVDDQGQPLKMYHGTPSSGFEVFDPYQGKFGLFGGGTYFTSNPDVAAGYSEKRPRRPDDNTPGIYQVYLSVQNPMDMDDNADMSMWADTFDYEEDFLEEEARTLARGKNIAIYAGVEPVTNEYAFKAVTEIWTYEGDMPQYEAAEAMISGLSEMGYDGLTHRGGGRVAADSVRHTVFIVWEPEQVKSAIGNIGTYDPADPNITREEGRGFWGDLEPDAETDPEKLWSAFMGSEPEPEPEPAAPGEPAPQTQAPRSFPLTAAKFGLPEGESLTYAPITNAVTENEARRKIGDMGVEGAVSELNDRIDGGQLEAIDTAVGVGAMAVYQARSNQAKADGDDEGATQAAAAGMRVASKLAEALTSAGQAIQAVKIIGRMTPESVLLYAQRRIQDINARRPGRLREDDPQVGEAEVEKLQSLAQTAVDFQGLGAVGLEAGELVERALKNEELEADDIARLRDFLGQVREVLGEETMGQIEESKRTKKGRRGAIDSIVSGLLGRKAKSARERLRSRGIELRTGIDPRDVRDYAIIGAQTMLNTGRKFAAWAEQMTEVTGLDIGDLRTVWKDSVDILREDRARGRRIYARSKAISDLLVAAESQPTLSMEDAVNLSQMVSNVREAVGEVQVELAQELAATLAAMEDPVFAEKVRSTQTMSQLLNPKTLMRNLIGNELFWYLERLSRINATAADIVVSKSTGRPREVTFRGAGRGGYGDYWSGLKRGSRAAWQGQDPYGLGGKFDMPSAPAFRGPGWIQQVVEAATGKEWKSDLNVPGFFEKVLGVALRGFDFAAFERARTRYLAEKAWLQAEREGVDEGKRRAFVDAYIANADQLEAEVQEAAEQAGLYTTFQDDTKLSETAVGLKRILNKFGFGPERNRFGLGDFIIKYPKTPANLFARAIEYSPMGYGHSLATLLEPWQQEGSRAEVNQEKLLMNLSRATIGTVGMLPLGIYLASKGVLVGAGEDDDETRRLLREEAGIAPNTVNLSALKRLATTLDPATLERREGDVYYAYNWLQPMAINVMVGANIAESLTRAELKAARTKGVPEASWWREVGLIALNAAQGGVSAFQEMPTLQALGSFDVRDPIRSLTDVVTSAPASFVPTASSMVASFMEPTRREAYRGDPLEKARNQILQKLPGLRDLVPPQYRTLGSRTEEGIPRYITNDRGELVPLVEEVPTFGGADEATPLWRLIETFVSPGRSDVYDPDPMVEMLLSAYEETGSTIGMPRRQARTMPLQRGANAYRATLTAEDFAELQKYLAEETTMELEQFNPEDMAEIDPLEQVEILRDALTQAQARTKDYWFRMMAHKYSPLPAVTTTLED